MFRKRNKNLFLVLILPPAKWLALEEMTSHLFGPLVLIGKMETLQNSKGFIGTITYCQFSVNRI